MKNTVAAGLVCGALVIGGGAAYGLYTNEQNKIDDARQTYVTVVEKYTDLYSTFESVVDKGRDLLATCENLHAECGALADSLKKAASIARECVAPEEKTVEGYGRAQKECAQATARLKEFIGHVKDSLPGIDSTLKDTVKQLWDSTREHGSAVLKQLQNLIGAADPSLPASNANSI